MIRCDASGLRAPSACYRSALRRGANMIIVGADPSLRIAPSTLRLDQHLMEQPRHRAAAAVADRFYPLVKVPEADLAAEDSRPALSLPGTPPPPTGHARTSNR